MADVLMDINRQDTICALATPLAPAAIAVIRVSGRQAEKIKGIVFRPLRGKQRPFVATLGILADPQSNEKVDEVLCVSFPEGKSYTGESAFELSLHGNPRLAQRILDILQANGCRLARPGEFTLRAVLTGKMDLCAAEAVQDLISAGSKVAADAALKGLEGGLKQRLNPMRGALVDALAELEARMDFPEDELGEANSEPLLAVMTQLQNDLNTLLQSASMGQRLTQGARVVLLGPPNVGKSTLLNTIIGEDRALVFDQPGTTRDVLEANWILNGVPISLIDVAGVRDHEGMDPVERMGIEKAKQEVHRADLILLLSEAQAPQDESLSQLLVAWAVSTEIPRLRIHTKIDLLAQTVRSSDVVLVSAQKNEGLKDLKAAMAAILITGDLSTDEVFLTRQRQKDEVQHCLNAVMEAERALENKWADEVITSELRSAATALDRLLGLDLNEDVLDSIFSKFCIGK